MDTAITVAAIAASVSVAGWFVTNILTGKANRKKAYLDAQIIHVQRQLAELYGPLAFLIYEGRAAFMDLRETLGRRQGEAVFPGGQPIPKGDLETWLFWVDHYFMPRNAKIQELLSTKAHLIEGGDLPESYVAFLNHHNSWRISHERWKKEHIPYSWHSRTNWPEDFAQEVRDTFRTLMRRHARLIGAAHITESRRTTAPPPP